MLADVPADATLACEEVFGPVLTVQKVDGEAEAFAAVNDSKYGLQAGVFTHDLQTAFRAHRALEVGGVIIGDVPSYRADQMPYGGVKQSGVGREGVRFAMDDYTYERVLVLTGLALYLRDRSDRCSDGRPGPPQPDPAGGRARRPTCGALRTCFCVPAAVRRARMRTCHWVARTRRRLRGTASGIGYIRTSSTGWYASAGAHARSARTGRVRPPTTRRGELLMTAPSAPSTRPRSPSAKRARSPRPHASRTGASPASPRNCSSAASGST